MVTRHAFAMSFLPLDHLSPFILLLLLQVHLLHNLLRSPRLLVPDVLAASQLVVAPSTIFTDPRQAVT